MTKVALLTEQTGAWTLPHWAPQSVSAPRTRPLSSCCSWNSQDPLKLQQPWIKLSLKALFVQSSLDVTGCWTAESFTHGISCDERGHTVCLSHDNTSDSSPEMSPKRKHLKLKEQLQKRSRSERVSIAFILWGASTLIDFMAIHQIYCYWYFQSGAEWWIDQEHPWSHAACVA